MEQGSRARVAAARGARDGQGRSYGTDPNDRARRAERDLLDAWPELSAGVPIWRWQRMALAGIALSLAAGAVTAPHITLTLCFSLLGLPFLCVVLLRAIALWALARNSRLPLGRLPVPVHATRTRASPATPGSTISEPELPLYSVLVPLNREADVVPDLIAALRAIDYPPHRLEVLLIVETDDQATRAAILGAAPPTHMRLVCVPPGAPRTKPRALNFALQEAAGDYVVIYDAEDCPEPRQLRDALALLKADTSGRLGCVQARLEIYNRGQSWLTRQFTIEYAALFYALLPALTSLGLPVPLSGTSNHFPRRVLADVGGWDPHNVTEDADLGIRLARMGYRVDVLDSATSEEAPRAYRSWLRQRTRWLKGWMQTYLVHMRQPARLWRELGPRRFAGFQILMGGLILSALVHPILLVSLGASLWQGRDLISDGSRLDAALSWLGLFNLAAGYVTGMAVGAAAVIAARLPTLAWGAVTMPIYWIVISLAAYRALLQLVTAPYLWEKTDHTARSSQAHAQVRPGGEDGANATARDPSLQSP